MMKQIIIAKAIIKQDQKILLLKRSANNNAHVGLYDLPGGKVDAGEDAATALRREVREEIGCELETLQPFDTHSVINDEQNKQYTLIVFIATISPKSSIRLSDEHNKYTWLTMSNIQPNELTEFTKTALNTQNNTVIVSNDKQKEKLINVNKTSNLTQVIIYCDGGSRGNPGPSASGFVIFDEHEQIIYQGGKYLGITTNNQAEYQAVRFALEKAQEIGARRLQFRLDSQLVVNQLTGVYQIKNRDLWPIHAHIKEMLRMFEKVTFTHVRREFNTVADAMVNKILDEHK